MCCYNAAAQPNGASQRLSKRNTTRKSTHHSTHGTTHTMHSMYDIPIPGVDTSNKIVTEIQGGREPPRESVFSKAKGVAGRLSRCSTGTNVQSTSQHSDGKDIEMGSMDKDGITVSYEVSRTVEDVSEGDLKG